MNPFAKPSEPKEDLLAGQQRSDSPWVDDEPEPVAASQAPRTFSRRRRGASPARETAAASDEQQAGSEQARGAASGDLPPPPPLVPAPLATEPPGNDSVPAVVQGVPFTGQQQPYGAQQQPFYPPAPGAWGAGYGGSAQPSPVDGYPPPPPGAPAGGMYGISSSTDYYGQPTGAPAGGAWTGGGYPADQPPSYATLEQQHGAAPGPPPRMKCGGLGEQWFLFLVGIIIWPLWYLASIWYCVSPAQQKEPRQRTPFILNCIASFVFTLVWVALVVRHSWNCDPSTSSYCWW